MEFDARIIGYINTFEVLTRAKVKDAFFDDNNALVFVTAQGEAGKAIGRGGSNVKRIASILKKMIRVIEFNSDDVEFVKNCIFPIKAKNIEKDGSLIKIKTEDSTTKAILIGRNRKNLNNLNSIVKKYFGAEVKIM